MNTPNDKATAQNPNQKSDSAAIPIPNIQALQFGYDLVKFDLYAPSASAGQQGVFDYPCVTPVSPSPDENYLIPEQMTYLAYGDTQFQASSHKLESSYDVQTSFSESVNMKGAFEEFSFSGSESYKTAGENTGSFESLQITSHSIHRSWRLSLIDDQLSPLTENFIDDVKKLPLTYGGYDPSDPYQIFIQNYGTHYIYEAVFGGRTYLTALMTTTASSSLVSDNIDTSVEAGVALAVSVGVTTDQSDSYKKFMSTAKSVSTANWLGGIPSHTWDNWIPTVDANPQIVNVNFVPVYELLTSAYFPDVSNIGQILTNMQQAYGDYMRLGTPNAVVPLPSSVYTPGQTVAPSCGAIIYTKAQYLAIMCGKSSGYYFIYPGLPSSYDVFNFLHPSSMGVAGAVNLGEIIYFGCSSLAGATDDWIMTTNPGSTLGDSAVIALPLETGQPDQTWTWQLMDPMSVSQVGQAMTGRLIQFLNPASKQYLQWSDASNLTLTADSTDPTTYWLLTALPTPPTNDD